MDIFEHILKEVSNDAEDRFHDYSNTQIEVPPEVSKKVVAFSKKIPEEELYIDPEDPSYGRDEDPHITVRYGLETNDPSSLEKAFSNFGSIEVKLGKISTFETDEYDVVKIDVNSEDLKRANELVGEVEEVPGETYKDYRPHLTIAYVRKGQGQKYVGEDSFQDLGFNVEEIILNDTFDNLHVIELN